MTLCLAWKRGGDISFASDSRLSSGDGNVISDIAAKIFTVDVKVGSSERHVYILDLKYGLCFSGSYLNGSVVADTIHELLSCIMISDKQDIEGLTIIQLAFRIYEDISRYLMSIHGKGGLSELWFGGICPKLKVYRIFKFSWKYNEKESGIEFFMDEELFKEPLTYLGDRNAIDLANELVHKIDFGKGYTEYHLIKHIIDDLNINTVGGAIQTGHFLRGKFTTFGMVDYEINELPNSNLHKVDSIFTFRGIPLRGSLEVVNDTFISTSKISMAPFTEKQNELNREVERMNNLEAK